MAMTTMRDALDLFPPFAQLQHGAMPRTKPQEASLYGRDLLLDVLEVLRLLLCVVKGSCLLLEDVLWPTGSKGFQH